MVTDLTGGEGRVISTETISVESVAICGDWLYFTANEGKLTGRITTGGEQLTVLAEQSDDGAAAADEQ